MENHPPHVSLIENFYTCFQQGDFEGMVACYHDQIRFSDPAFGELHGKTVSKMWEMLISKSKKPILITFSDIVANEASGSATWQATYHFGKSQRLVRNHIKAHFEFSQGMIITHHDHFDMWKWSQQALGWHGWLLGWTPWMKRKIRTQSLNMLSKFEE
jgi:hypothetical protein